MVLAMSVDRLSAQVKVVVRSLAPVKTVVLLLEPVMEVELLSMLAKLEVETNWKS